jgi:2-dehydrotetronate isomerase
MFKLAANLDWLWKELPLQARMESASKAGFHHLESLNPYAQDIQLWKDLLKTHQLELVLMNTPPGSSADQKVKGLAAWPSKQTEFRSCFTVAVNYAQALSAPLIHATAG